MKIPFHIAASTLALIILSVFIPVRDVYSSDGECSDGDIRYTDFLHTFSDSLDIWQSVKDFTKNSCQLEDIMAAENQIRKAKSQVQNAFLACDDARIANSADTFRALKVEAYYLRSFASCDTSDSCYFETSDSIELVDVSQALIDEFVTRKAWFSKEALASIYADLQKKYEDRGVVYADCNPGDWSEVKEKGMRFWDTIKMLVTHDPLTSLKTLGSEEIAKQQKARRARHASGVTSLSDIGKSIKDSTKSGMIDGLKKRADLKINGLDPTKGIDEIGEAFTSMLPGGAENATDEGLSDSAKQFLGKVGTAPIFSDILTEHIADSARYEEALSETDMLLRYRILYGETRDDITSTLLSKLDLLRDTIDDTIPELNKTGRCTLHITKRQCINKQ